MDYGNYAKEFSQPQIIGVNAWVCTRPYVGVVSLCAQSILVSNVGRLIGDGIPRLRLDVKPSNIKKC